MATQTVFEKVSQGPGPIGPSPSFLLHAGESAIVRITANTGTGANQFDHVDGEGVPTLIVDVQVDESEDGIDYVSGPPSKISGGGRGKDGKLPSVSVTNTAGGDRHYRVTMTTNKELPIGLNWEQGA